MKIFKLVLIGVMSTGLMACEEDIEIHAPDDSVVSTCSQGIIGNSKITCLSPYEKVPVTEGLGSALVVFIEPGDYNSNIALQDESIRTVVNSIPKDYEQIKPFLRQILINLSVAHINLLIESFGSKYNNIYLYRTDLPWTAHSVGSVLRTVLQTNKTVDLLLQTHGNRGSLAISPQFDKTLTVEDLKDWAESFTKSERSRVRAIFNTACFAGAELLLGTENVSISKQLVKVFPRATTYGSKSVNYGPLHRDMVAFENYYATGASFDSAVYLGNMMMTKTIISGYTQDRYFLHFPKISIRGQVRVMGFTKSERRTFSLSPLAFPTYLHSGSWAHVEKGAEVLESPTINSELSLVQESEHEATDSVEASTSSAGFNMVSAATELPGCFFKNKYYKHGEGFIERNSLWLGSGESAEVVWEQYQVNCNQGQLEKSLIKNEIVPTLDQSGGY